MGTDAGPPDSCPVEPTRDRRGRRRDRHGLVCKTPDSHRDVVGGDNRGLVKRVPVFCAGWLDGDGGVDNGWACVGDTRTRDRTGRVVSVLTIVTPGDPSVSNGEVTMTVTGDGSLNWTSGRSEW